MREDPFPAWEKAFRIVPKEGGLVTLHPNTVQQRLHYALMDQRKAGHAQRAIVYKARQTGISTYMEARLVTIALTEPYSQSLIIAHVEVAVEGLHEKTRLTLEKLPWAIRPVMPPPRRDRIILHGIPCTDGRIGLHSMIATAKATGKPRWRSMTLRAVHLSELAFYPDAGAVLDGVLQSVPSDPGSLVVIESTAFGATGTFYDEWHRAKEGGSDFAPIFVPWHEMVEYQRPAPSPFVKTDEERILVATFGCTNEQLEWRRWCIKNNCRGDEAKFQQEYPATEEDGFWLTGMPAFPAEKLRAMLNVALQHNAKTVGWFDTNAQRPIPAERGPYQEWFPPEDGHDYVVSGDASAGTKDGDYSAVIVYDRMREMVVATWHGKCAPGELGQIMFAIGHYYKVAVMAPEVNNHGLAVVEVLKNQFYPRWYFWQRVDKATNAMSRYLGWETSFRNRQLMIDTMRWALINDAVAILDPGVIREMLEFEYLPGDDTHAEGRVHDDRAMALMIAYRVHVETPMPGTGLPPQLKLPQEDLPEARSVVPVTSTEAMHAEVWDETDQTLKSIDHAQNNQQDWWDTPDLDGPLGLQEAPEMRW